MFPPGSGLNAVHAGFISGKKGANFARACSESVRYVVIFPPNGWRCRCTVFPITISGLGSRTVEKPNDSKIIEKEVRVGTDNDTGEVINRQIKGIRTKDALGKAVDVFPDAGFGYNVGQSWIKQLHGLQEAAERSLKNERAIAVRNAGKTKPFDPSIFTDIFDPAIRELLARRATEARKEVIERGKQSGLEHLVVYSAKDAKIVGRAEGFADRVSLPSDLSKKLDKSDSDLVLHHNHPSDFSLSRADLLLLSRNGIRVVFAHGHNDSYYAARIFNRSMRAKLNTAIDAGYGEMLKHIKAWRMRGLIAAGLEAHLLNLSLASAGVIEYKFQLPSVIAQSFEIDVDLYAQGMDNIVNSINQAIKP